MRFPPWLRALDAHNQRVMDAYVDRVEATGPGIVVHNELPGTERIPRYPARVSIDDAKPERLLLGSTFHGASPGHHTLTVDNGRRWLRFPLHRSATVDVEVPAAPAVVHVDCETWKHLRVRQEPT